MKFTIDKYEEMYATLNQETHHIIEVETIDGVRMYEIVKNEVVDNSLEIEEMELRNELEKIKEDIEQVTLFDMPRDDLKSKQVRASEIVIRLREIESLGEDK